MTTARVVVAAGVGLATTIKPNCRLASGIASHRTKEAQRECG